MTQERLSTVIQQSLIGVAAVWLWLTFAYARLIRRLNSGTSKLFNGILALPSG